MDQYISGPKGEIDWITMGEDYGMSAFFSSVDATMMGRGTYEFGRRSGNKFFTNMKNYVFSNSLTAGTEGEVEIIGGDAVEFARELKQQNGKDIWLFGGHKLTASMLTAGEVDEVRLAVYPVLLGGGVPVFGSLMERQMWKLEEAKGYPGGVLVVRYARER